MATESQDERATALHAHTHPTMFYIHLVIRMYAHNLDDNIQALGFIVTPNDTL